MPSGLEALFRPRSVAVVGASRRRGSLGAEIVRNLISHGFTGAVYPVNRSATVVQSVRAFPTVSAIPEEVDLAVLAVPKDQVAEAVEDCGRKGVKALVVISAGFAEVGPAGRALQDDLLARARHHGMRLVGPNCLGLVNTDPEVQLDATFAPVWPPPGNVAFSSQSGALGVAILDHARSLGIGIRHFISVGNKADVSGNDLLEFWEHDPDIRVILFYLESLGRPGRFMQIARRVARRKPIVVVKSGRTEAGARAASSHTGSLAGMDVAVDALFGQAGVIRTDTIEELFDLALLLANQPVPAGDRVAILTNAGGPGIMASDACESHGLQVARLSPETEAALARFLPAEASVRNPVDMLADAQPGLYERALELLLADAGVDAVLALFVPPVVTEATDVAAAICRGAAGSPKPVLTCFMGVHGVPEALNSLRLGKFPSYSFPESAARALSGAVRYGRWLARPEGGIPDLPGVDSERARALVAARPEGWLDPATTAELLACYGIPTLRSGLAGDPAEAARLAAELGFPVAVKLHSATITHKSDVGGVVLGLETPEAVAAACEAIRGRLRASGREGEMAGVQVQAMAPRGVETFVGVVHDPAYGPLIAFGSGGVNVEIWRDVVFRVHPITDQDAREMLERIRGASLLDGHRGAPPADRAALVETLLRVGRMVADLPRLRELDLNPLIARPVGQGVVAVDARLRLEGEG